MLEASTKSEAIAIVLAGVTFVPIAVLAGSFARNHAGPATRKRTGLLALGFGLLVAAHVLILSWLGRYHPAIGAFYMGTGGLFASTARARTVPQRDACRLSGGSKGRTLP